MTRIQIETSLVGSRIDEMRGVLSFKPGLSETHRELIKEIAMPVLRDGEDPAKRTTLIFPLIGYEEIGPMAEDIARHMHQEGSRVTLNGNPYFENYVGQIGLQEAMDRIPRFANPN